ncbi:MAG: hypothetical protein N2037_14035, partial [Acidimicrobiales bacterium]|nr:hypothetical protein [Acidimicrobiales bacterium]
RRWTNPSQPQTLYIAQFLLYFDAVWLLIRGALFTPIGLLLIVGSAAGAFGIANEQKWGYWLGLAVAGFSLFFTAYPLFRTDGLRLLLDIFYLIALVFAVALVVLLLHPESRDYQRIWFR